MTRFSSPDNIVSPFYRESLKFKNCFEFYPTFLQDSWYNDMFQRRFALRLNIISILRDIFQTRCSLLLLYFFFKRKTNHEGFNASAWFL